MKIDIMGVPFDSVTMGEALEQAKILLHGDKPSYCVTPNPEIVYETMHNPEFARLVNNASLILPDGIGVIYAGKILKTPLKEKVTGVGFATNLLSILAEEGLPLYLLGSKPGVAQLAGEKMVELHPNLQICGVADGYFKDENQVVAKIREAKPAALFVCLGSPKQEQFMANYAQELGASLMVGLGGTLDVFAGTVQRAPAWTQKIGMEWLYRMVKEPKRFKRFMRLPKFMFAVLGKRLKGC
ncbi:MAG: WecB/TagA/CpsF family glycosyltransferase [Eubacteriales bacterium]